MLESKSSNFKSVSACLLNRVQLFAAPQTIVHQAPLSMRFSWQKYWSGWDAISFSKGISQSKDQNHIFCISCIARWILYHCATWEAQFQLQFACLFFPMSFCVFALVLSKVFYSNQTILKYFENFLHYYFYYTSSPKCIHYSHQFSRIEINIMYISLDGIVYLSERSQSTIDCSRMNYWENPWLLIYGPQYARLFVLMREEWSTCMVGCSAVSWTNTSFLKGNEEKIIYQNCSTATWSMCHICLMKVLWLVHS